MATEHWHVKREITAGHMVSTLMLAGALIVAWDDMGDKIDLTTLQIETIQVNDARQDENRQQIRQEMKEELKAINGKLDRLIEREINNNHQ